MYRDPLAALSAKPMRPALSSRELEFALQYLEDADPEKAALRAGCKDPYLDGPNFLRRKPVVAAIQAMQSSRAARVETKHDYVLRCWLELLDADHREISEHWRVACRHCHGVEHQYQFTDVELRDEEQAHKYHQLQITDASRRVEFDDLGGGGYSILRDPMRGPDWVEFVLRKNVAIRDPVANADHSCPACHGFGVPHVIFHDTRNLSKGAARLYQGVRVHKGDYEIVTRPKKEVEELVARHLGYFVERRLTIVKDLDRMTEAELEAALRDEYRERDRLLAIAGRAESGEDGEQAPPHSPGLAGVGA